MSLLFHRAARISIEFKLAVLRDIYGSFLTAINKGLLLRMTLKSDLTDKDLTTSTRKVTQLQHWRVARCVAALGR